MAERHPRLSSLASNIQQGVENRLKDLHTAMPGIVQAFDASTQLASVQCAIKRLFITRTNAEETLTAVDLPPLINVPVIFPRGGGFSLTFPVQPGDECLLVFCERAIDLWHETGATEVPNAKRFHALSDAVALVGLSSTPKKVPNYDDTNVQLKRDDGSVEFTLLTNGTVVLKADTKATVDVPDAEFTGNVKIVGNLEVIGDSTLSDTVTSSGTDISNTHTHTGSPSSPVGPVSNTGAPV